MHQTDVVVIGAGIMGCSIAWRLAREGRRVVLLDRGEPGGEASSAAAGLLQPEAGREAGPQLLALWRRSLASYPTFVAEVRDATQATFDFRICGRLVVALSEAEETALRERARAQAEAGIACEWLDAARIRELEPNVSPSARAALYFAEHGLVDNARLTRALATAVARSGGNVRPYEPVVRIAVAGGRVVGVETPSERYAADVVVNAAGAWSAGLAPASAPAPDQPPLVRPARGEIIALETPVRPVERIVSISSGSVSARSDGRVVVGATVADVGFDKQLTAGGVAAMLACAVDAVPALRQARFLDAWTGLRPKTTDQQPVIGPDPIPGLFWATGHYKMGILSAPGTAEAVADLIEGRRPSVAVDQLGPERFARVGA